MDDELNPYAPPKTQKTMPDDARSNDEERDPQDPRWISRARTVRAIGSIALTGAFELGAFVWFSTFGSHRPKSFSPKNAVTSLACLVLAFILGRAGRSLKALESKGRTYLSIALVASGILGLIEMWVADAERAIVILLVAHFVIGVSMYAYLERVGRRVLRSTPHPHPNEIGTATGWVLVAIAIWLLAIVAIGAPIVPR